MDQQAIGIVFEKVWCLFVLLGLYIVMYTVLCKCRSFVWSISLLRGGGSPRLSEQTQDLRVVSSVCCNIRQDYESGI